MVNQIGSAANTDKGECERDMAVRTENADKEPKLEESFEKLDRILDRLESPDISLEESFQVYESGMKLLKQCNEIIDRVEKNVLKLNENGELEEL